VSWPAPYTGLRIGEVSDCSPTTVSRIGYTASMTQRVGAKGQVVIPKELRDGLGLQPGAEVAFERDGDSVRIVAAGPAATHGLRGRYMAEGGMASALLADRAREPR
jgi:AbrB family looped-hinge helix DNA binding protein